MTDQSSPRLSQADRATARKALWDLRAEVATAIDDVMLRRGTYASLHDALSAVEARVATLRRALASAEAGKPVSGPLRAARGYPEDDPGVNLPPGAVLPRVDDPSTWPTDSQGHPVSPPWELP